MVPFLALTITPSIAPSSADETCPLRAAAACACADADMSADTATARPTQAAMLTHVTSVLSRIVASLDDFWRWRLSRQDNTGDKSSKNRSCSTLLVDPSFRPRPCGPRAPSDSGARRHRMHNAGGFAEKSHYRRNE